MIENRSKQDTICAISTPPGMGGIGIVRMSGPEAVCLAGEVFVDSKGKRLDHCQGYSIRYGKIVEPARKRVVDEVLLTVMRAPKTYTREDVVEINCHSGPVIVKEILMLLISLGARPAEPGEFTKRAYLNGRIDLAQAEAVMSMIAAKTERALRVALHQLGGELSGRVNRLKTEMIHLLSEVEASIDFPDEDLDLLPSGEISTAAHKIVKELDALIESGKEGRLLQEGILTAIIGKANVGKSSLLNLLVKDDRAIVTPFPGTTRDVIESAVNIDGVPFRILDTAGIRFTADPVEQEGIKRSRASIARADLILTMFDLSQPPDEEDYEIARLIREKDVIVLLNKKDLVENEMNSMEEYDRIIRQISPKSTLNTCMLSDNGINGLKKELSGLIFQGRNGFSESSIVTEVRHLEALDSAREALSRVAFHAAQGLSEEFLSVDLRGGLQAIGRITGETVTEEILEEIFRNFCVGK